ncbi:hypothetical protein [Terrihalobacillus insolitus]|uniref:hypothetical protein n=1 Tax=Terrihalobacillus insolitus TaxID=2950438 RepID=UPI0023413651|nr:hypothetical protein [Terrihalobacillus insolitus]MDC3415013.1 hypothetical protein [Terrihalobacillus insolitus]
MEEKLDLILQEIRGINAKITTIDTRLGTVETRLDGIDSRLDKAETEQKRHGDHIHQLIETVAATNVRLENMYEEFNEKFHDLNKKHDSLEKRMDVVEDDLNIIKTNMVTKQDLFYYDQKISEHEREIYKMKLR